MSTLPASVEHCLTSKYQYIYQTREDLLRVCKESLGLKPRTKLFVFNDGSSKELVCLEGTIPVRYKNANYNFPVRIWLLDTHPYHAPICFVCPTPKMQIKTSHLVGEDGRVYLPYLNTWSSGADLSQLIEVMSQEFGTTPPVFSLPKGAAAKPLVQTAFPYPPRNDGGFPTPYPSTANGGSMPQMPNPALNSNNNTWSLSDEHIRISLLSAVESRIAQRALEFEQKSKAEEEVLKKTNEELLQGKTKLNKLMTDMENDCRELDSNLTILREKNEQLKQAVEQMSSSENGGVDIDNAVTTTAPLYRQLVNAYAEESAVEDAIYFIGEGLRKEVIDLDTFLKHVRELSRKQFMLRALMQKCRQKAGLPAL